MKEVKMSRKIFLTALFTFFTVSAFPEYCLGLKGGYNTSLGFDGAWNYSKNTLNFKKDVGNGFNVGLMSRFGGRVYAQIEALYELRSTKYTFEEYTNRLTEHFINVPVMVGFKIIHAKNFNWRIMAGPTFNFNVGASDFEGGLIVADTHKALVGLDCGTGVDLWRVAIDLRYKLVKNTYDFKLNGESINKRPVNAFELSFAWKFLDRKK